MVSEETMHSSVDLSRVPLQGETVDLMDEDRIAALLEGLDAEDLSANSDILDDILEEDEDGDAIEEEDLDIPRLTAETFEPLESDSVPSIPQGEREEQKQENVGKSKTYLVAIVATLLVVVVVCIIKATNNKKGSGADAPENTTPTLSETRYRSDVITATDTTTYRDVMAIEKYIVLDKDSCLYVFEGYAENARAFVKSYVDLDTYNIYRDGARIPIIYERITLNDKDYYMKVRILKDET